MSIALNHEKLIDSVDEHDQAIGVVRKAEALSRGVNFRVAHTFLFDSSGQLWLQQLPSSHLRHPLQWGSSVAGYVLTGEEYSDAAKRRLYQELGVRRVDLHQYLSTSMVDERSTKFIVLYVGLWDGPFPKVDQSHIHAVEALTPSRIQEMRVTGERRFTPTFLHLFEVFTNERSTTG